MRLRQTEEGLHAQFTVAWEVAMLAEQGDRWLPLCLVGTTTPIGHIHASTHEVRLAPGVTVTDRQAVALAPPGERGEDRDRQQITPEQDG